MSLFTRKKINIPTGETIQTEGLKSWTLKWNAQKRDYPWNEPIPQYEVFLNLEDARTFGDRLHEAHNFLRNGYTLGVDITENKAL